MRVRSQGGTGMRTLSEALDAYIAQPIGPRRLTLVATSPHSTAAQPVWTRLAELRARDVAVRVVFAAPATATQAAAARYDAVFGRGAARRAISVAAFAKSPPLIEQVAFGFEVWSAPLCLRGGDLQQVTDDVARASSAYDAAEVSFRVVAGMSRPAQARLHDGARAWFADLMTATGRLLPARVATG